MKAPSNLRASLKEFRDPNLSASRAPGQSPSATGREMHALAAELFPICRSITGDGLRVTLRRIQQEIPITIHEVPTGTAVFDWTIPDEWNMRDAWIKNSNGEKIVDFQRSNLHVVNYSVPVHSRMDLAELKPHLHSLPDQPEFVPYRTSYYKRDWGFCLSHRDLQQLSNGKYDVCIDATLAPGSLSYGEMFIAGETNDEFLVSCHCCHPSLANDNLSGIAVAVQLAKALSTRNQRPQLSYRFLFIPGTIGVITWLARNEGRVERIKHGLVLTCLGDAGNFTYKKSRRGDAAIDRTVQQVLQESGQPRRIVDFFPYGYDERQYCSPGFNLPVGCLMRSQHGAFPEYHTSADNLDFIKPKSLADSLETLLRVISLTEEMRGGPCPRREPGKSPAADRKSPVFLNLKPKGEPQLGKYGLYDAMNGDVMPALWLLNFSDGEHSLAEVAARAGLPFDNLARTADILVSRGLLKEVEP